MIGSRRLKKPCRHWSVGVSLLMVFLTSCAGPSVNDQAGPGAKRSGYGEQFSSPDSSVGLGDEIERLKDRARLYWQARMKRDLVATYELHEPGFKRAVTLTGFLQGKGVSRVLAFDILGARVDGPLGIIQVKFQAKTEHPLLVKPVEPVWHEIEEQWILADGKWFRKFRFSSANPYPPVDWDEIARQRGQTPGDLPK